MRGFLISAVLVMLSIPRSGRAQPAAPAVPAPSAPPVDQDPPAPAPAPLPPGLPPPVPVASPDDGAPLTEPLPMFSPMYQPTFPPPPYQRMPMEPSPFRAMRSGPTLEASAGMGWLHARNAQTDETATSELGFALDIGIGGWASSDLAVTLRVASVSESKDGATLTSAFVGPSAQAWITDHVWFGGGIGVAILGLRQPGSFGATWDRTAGLGVDLRAGYNFTTTGAHTVNVSLEADPGFYSRRGSNVTIAGIALLVGYQFI